jgi:hypothetical protein
LVTWTWVALHRNSFTFFSSFFARVSQTKQNNSVINLKFKNLFAATNNKKSAFYRKKIMEARLDRRLLFVEWGTDERDCYICVNMRTTTTTSSAHTFSLVFLLCPRQIIQKLLAVTQKNFFFGSAFHHSLEIERFNLH